MGENVQYFISKLEQEIGQEAATQVLHTAQEIFNHAPKMGEAKRKLGLLYGLVQSGKTNIINMTTALAIDHSFKLSIILTDRNNTLQMQTFGRSEDALSTPYICPISKVEDTDFELLETMLLTDGLVLISKKDPGDLKKLDNLLNNSFSSTVDFSNILTLIIDDEADAVGLNTKQRSEDSDNNTSTINSALLKLRETFNNHLMLQVTATPQAIILQNNVPGGFYPEFTVLSTAGEGYVGIDEFFSVESSTKYLRSVDASEVQTIKELSTANGVELPKGLLDSLNTFIISCAIKIIEDPNSQKNQFTYLCHISQSQNVHETLRVLVKKYLTLLILALKSPEELATRDEILDGLSRSYNDLNKTYENIPEFPTVLDAINKNITSHDVLIVNSSENGIRELVFNRKFNFVIGGNRLNRGITLPRLLVTYYGRSSNRPQVDTLFQHARMCGYRSKDLDVTRIFITRELAAIFATISEHDSKQRELIKKHGLQSVLYLDNDIVKPTRPNVIPKMVGIYNPGESTFPNIPEFHKEKIEHITTYIDNKLAHLEPKKVHSVDIELISDIITKIPSISPGSWNELVIYSFLNTYYADNSTDKKINLIITKADNGLSESRGSKGLSAILSPTTQQLAKRADPTIPLVILTKNPGTKCDSNNIPFWDNTKFWIPWFRLPETELPILFNFDNF